jgi:glycosyltransferase involved in cell wall biosynthesis
MDHTLNLDHSSLPAQEDTFIVIPAHNEEKNLPRVLEEAKKLSKNLRNIIVVDDGSKDKTSQVAKDHQVILLKHLVNLGKGSALRTGCDYALLQGAKHLVVLDADGQHDPKEVPRFLELLKSHDLILGTRKMASNMPFVLKFGNRFINRAFSTFYGIRVHDSQSGYRAFTAEAYKKIRWETTDYFMETEMLIKASKHNLNYVEIPIQTIYSDNYKGTTVLDGFKIVSKLIGWKVFR